MNPQQVSPLARIVIFAILNFGALGIGGLLLGNPLTNTWYQQVHKAPWTPPGWVFGAAWFSIMVCYTAFMYYSTRTVPFSIHRPVYLFFIIQWVLNIMWNPIFFRWHMVGFGLIVIISLGVVVAYFTWYGFRNLTYAGLLMLPYLVWLAIAASLNAYVYLYN